MHDVVKNNKDPVMVLLTRWLRSQHKTVRVGYMEEKVALGQGFAEYFGIY